ncbi:DUF2797 domain-containing protein [Plebeiibacterium sediminum]|uniref:DUF2797 domain-containing protein n=1 Tax=Plebeiibacterium sediminum TaxID=2992112 RepID=A0AAE3SDR7_9BACT|nr:DUF2797 domain-containing protein [Plebeiobacterium sediminum]MCW3785162.1 DUF2797 domain-containing protein [Plebeiobacterium sediminum]
MEYIGNIEKMLTQLDDNVKYILPIGEERIEMNQYIGKQISLQFQNQINCVACGTKTNKSFAQGFCFNCFSSAPEASECILHPDKCQAHLGISRDMQWSINHCLTPHIVYLANSSNIKVGITRKTQIPTRWIDQGATAAIIIAVTPNRHIAGIIEKYLMQYYSDKTSWQSMLKGVSNHVDLSAEKAKVKSLLPAELLQYYSTSDDITTIKFPVEEYPVKIKSESFDKTQNVEGVLTGIKGQYLILDHSRVINIRKHRGYLVKFTI